MQKQLFGFLNVKFRLKRALVISAVLSIVFLQTNCYADGEIITYPQKLGDPISALGEGSISKFAIFDTCDDAIKTAKDYYFGALTKVARACQNLGGRTQWGPEVFNPGHNTCRQVEDRLVHTRSINGTCAEVHVAPPPHDAPIQDPVNPMPTPTPTPEMY
ncbi:MAG: hypothetical protein ACKVQC_04060 [Elusimicrobiota bacterium]